MRRPVLIISLVMIVAITSFAYSDDGSRIDTLSEPQDLTAYPGNGIVRLYWSEPTIGSATVLGYRLYRGTSGSDLSIRKDLPGSGTSFVDQVENGVLYYYTVTAYNALGESQPSQMASCTGDGVDPELSIDRPVEGAYLKGSDIDVTWTGSDPGSGILRYEIALDDGSNINVGLAKDHTFPDIDDGEHIISVEAYDNALNSKVSSVGVTLDNAPPEVEIVNPTEDEATNSEDILVRWLMSDGLSGVEGSTITLDDDEKSNVGELDEYIFKDMLEGHHMLTLETSDRSGNIAIDVVNFTVDRTGPVVRLTDLPEYVAKPEVEMGIAINDQLDLDPILEILLNGKMMKASVEEGRITVKGLIEGYNNITARAIDRAGNDNEDHFRVYFDATPPDIFTDLDGISELTKRNITMKYWTGDDGSGVDEVLISIDGSEPVGVENIGSRLIRFDRDGDHTIRLTASDRMNNRIVHSIDVLIDSLMPSILDFSPKGYVTNMNEVVQVTFSEPMDRERTAIESPMMTGTIGWEGNMAVLYPDSLPMALTIVVYVSGYDLIGNPLGERRFEFETTSDGTITGTVVGPDGGPIPDATVTLDSGRTIKTLSDGTFTISEKGGPDHYIVVSKKGYQDLRMDLPIVPGREYRAGIIQLEESSDEGPSDYAKAVRTIGIAIGIISAIGLLVYLMVLARKVRYDD